MRCSRQEIREQITKPYFGITHGRADIRARSSLVQYTRWHHQLTTHDWNFKQLLHKLLFNLFLLLAGLDKAILLISVFQVLAQESALHTNTSTAYKLLLKFSFSGVFRFNLIYQIKHQHKFSTSFLIPQLNSYTANEK